MTDKDNYDKEFEPGQFSLDPNFNICIMAKHKNEKAFIAFLELIPNYMEFRRLVITDDWIHLAFS